MMRRTRRGLLGSIATGTLAALAGCAGLGRTDTEQQSMMETGATDTGDAPTKTPTATLTPSPTATDTPTATPSPTPTPTETPHEVAEMTGKEAETEFGAAVAVDGDTAVVGQPLDDPNGHRSGSAVVFGRYGGDWQRRAKLVPESGGERHLFGAAAAVDGDTVLVGAQNARGFTGRAHVYEREGTGWSRTATLDPGSLGPNYHAGVAVALAGDLAVVGAYTADGGENPPGAAFVYERADGGWSQAAKLVAADGDGRDMFGLAVAATSDTVLVAAPNDEDGGGAGKGSAYVFERADSGWTQQAKLTGSNDDGYFGTAVSVANGRVLVGAEEQGGANGPKSGAVYAFERDGSGWVREATLAPDDGDERDRFGSAVSMAGDTAVVGARTNEGPADGETAAGSAYLFAYDDGWTRRAELGASDATLGANFGDAVSTTTETAVVGAPLAKHDGTQTGSAYLFDV